MKYFKGHSKKDGRQMIFEVYDKPQEGLFDKDYLVIASAIEKTGKTDYPSLESCEEENYIERKISETEYKCYELIQMLLTEMFMNGYTGGFPRDPVMMRLVRELPRGIARWMNSFEVEEYKA